MALEPLNLTPIRHELMQTGSISPSGKRDIQPPPGIPGSPGLGYGGPFKAAQLGRLTTDWITQILSADQELWSDLRRLRARSRTLCKNNQYAAKFLRQLEKNVIGEHGITFRAKVKKQRGEGLLEAVNAELHRAWKDWGHPEYCSVSGRLNWHWTQVFLVRNLAMDGEVLIRKVPMPGNPHMYSLDFIDPDQLDATFFIDRLPNGNEVRMGVEVDQFHRPIAYHVWNRHPSEYTANPRLRIRIPAAEVLHIFLPLRVNQTRGIPWMAPAMFEMNMLGGYKEAEVIAARISACKMGFFVSQTGEEYTGDPSVSGSQSAFGQGDAPPLMNVSPGSFETLPAGMDLKPFDPQHPNNAYASFMKEALRGIASGLDVAYPFLANDLEGVNFSSIRAGMLDERDTYKMIQKFLVEFVCRPIYNAWLPNSILGGALQLAPENLDAYVQGASWHPRGWDWVDPLKDVTASSLEIQNGMSTITRELAERGLDFDELMQERKRELDVISALGLVIGTDTKGIADTAAEDDKIEESDDTQQGGEKPNGGKSNAKK